MKHTSNLLLNTTYTSLHLISPTNRDDIVVFEVRLNKVIKETSYQTLFLFVHHLKDSSTSAKL